MWHIQQPALGHDFDPYDLTWTWSSGCGSCTATLPCSRSGCSYSATQTRTSTQTNYRAATCTAKETWDYSVTFTNSYIVAALNEMWGSATIACDEWHYGAAATGHSYGTASYTWSSDHTSCTAQTTCSKCSKVLKETKTATVRWSTNTTCTTQGKYDYYISSWSNSTYFSAKACPDYHYQAAYNHSSTYATYNQDADGWWADLWGTKHCKITKCNYCGIEISRTDEAHSYLRAGEIDFIGVTPQQRFYCACGTYSYSMSGIVAP